MSFDVTQYGKYRRIVAQPHIDGIFASGLLNRIFNVVLCFKLFLRRAKYSILVGMPIHINAQISQSFIIDIINCEKVFKGTLTTNFILCNNKYGSLTDFVVDIFDFDVPDDLLDAVYEISTKDVPENSFSEKLLVSWLISGKSVRKELATLVQRSRWEEIRTWAHEKSSGALARHIIDMGHRLKERFQTLLPWVAAIRFSIKNKVERLAAKYLLHNSSDIAPVIVILGCDQQKVKLCFIHSQRYDLTLLSNFLENLGYATIARPHIIRIHLDEAINPFINRLILALRSSHKRIK